MGLNRYVYIYKHTKHGSSWWWGLVKGRQWFSCFNLPQKVLPFNRELTNFESMVFNDGWKLLGILHPIFHIFLGILLDISYISGDSPRYFIYFWILHGFSMDYGHRFLTKRGPPLGWLKNARSDGSDGSDGWCWEALRSDWARGSPWSF